MEERRGTNFRLSNPYAAQGDNIENEEEKTPISSRLNLQP